MNDLKKEILTTENVDQLYELQIDISEKIATLHKNIFTATDALQKIEAKGELTIATACHEVIIHRIADVKELLQQEKNLQNQLNHNFRKAAKMMLSNDTYKKITEIASKARREAILMKGDYEENKLE